MNKSICKIKVLVILLATILLVGCSLKPRDAKPEQFVGKWILTVEDLPEIGDIKAQFNVTYNDSVLSGYIFDMKYGKTDIDKLKIDNGNIRAYYTWGDNNVNLKLRIDENDSSKIEGRLLGIFKVKGHLFVRSKRNVLKQ